MLHRRTVVGITLANVVLAMLAFTAVPLPPSSGAPEPDPAGTVRLPPPEEQGLLGIALRDLRSGDRDDRLVALRVLGALGDRRAAGHAEAYTASDDRGIALEASRAVARITGDPGALLSLVARSVDEQGAVAALADCPGADVDEALFRLAAPRDPFVRGAALRALARRRPAEAVPLVADALGSVEPVVRMQALEVAVQCPDRSYEPTLREAAGSDDPMERRLALGALARSGDPQAADELRSMVEDGDPWESLFVAETMAWARVPGADTRWRGALQGFAPLERSAALLRLMAGIPESLHAPLRVFLGDRDLDTRVSAALALGTAGDAAARDVLAQDGPQCSSAALAADAVVVLASLSRR